MKLLTDHQVADMLTVSRGYVWKLSREDKNFPKPINLGQGAATTRAKRWVQEDVEAWVRLRASRRQQPAPQGEDTVV